MKTTKQTVNATTNTTKFIDIGVGLVPIEGITNVFCVIETEKKISGSAFKIFDTHTFYLIRVWYNNEQLEFSFKNESDMNYAYAVLVEALDDLGLIYKVKVD